MSSSEPTMATARQDDGFVEIAFSERISHDVLKAQVDSCRDETCECCTPAFREEVDEIVIVQDDQAKVRIYGTISKDDVLENMLGCVPKLAGEEP